MQNFNQKIVIDQRAFNFNDGCRLLKMRYKECPFEEIADFWDDILPMTFQEIARTFSNVEERRIAISCLGIDNLVKEVNPILVDSSTIEKTTTWVGEDGTMTEVKFQDTYELYKVTAEALGLKEGNRSSNGIENYYYVKCKDTSTDRNYLIWVDIDSVAMTNNPDLSVWSVDNSHRNKVTAIQAVAWTIQTDIPEGCIDKIVRQGDCILVKPKKDPCSYARQERHLSEKEYLTLIVAES